MRLIANIAQADCHGVPQLSSLAQVTATDSGWLLSLVLRVSDKRLIGGCLLPAGSERACEAVLHARLAALSAKLSADGADASIVGSHVGKAAGVLAQTLRRRPLSGQSVLSAKQLRIAMSVLESDLDRTLNTPEVASMCGVSEGHLRRAFKTCTGLSPMKWRQERRLQVCRKRLVQTDEPMADIARKAGFAVQSHFSRVFTRATGMSPSEWRRLFQSASRASITALDMANQCADAPVRRIPRP